MDFRERSMPGVVSEHSQRAVQFVNDINELAIGMECKMTRSGAGIKEFAVIKTIWID